MSVKIAFILGLGLLLASTCKDSIVYVEQGPTAVEDEQEHIFLVDIKGQRLDITQAVNDYGFDPAEFENGLGAGATPPILTPQFIGPEDRRYPDSSEDFLMMGVDLRGESRAYPIIVMIQHEVVDDLFLDEHVAVAY